MTTTADVPARPLHPMGQLTSYELRNYRAELEVAIKGIADDAPVQTLLHARLDAVVAEEQDRQRIRDANGIV